MRWAGHVACMGAMRNGHRNFVRKSEEMRQLGRTRRRWEDNIRMDLREIRSEVVDWIHLTQDRGQLRTLVNTVINLPRFIKVREFVD
jgi:hypothetical protein